MVACSLTGCAQTRLSHEPGLVTGWNRKPPALVVPAPTLSLELDSRHLSFGEPVESPLDKWWTTRSVRQRLEDMRGEFPMLARASWKDPTAAYRLAIEATHVADGNRKLHWISEATKYVIPCSYQASIELDARLFHGDTLLKRYDATGTYRVRQHLLWLLVPWAWHPRVPRATARDTFRDLFLQIQQDAPTLLANGEMPVTGGEP